MEHLLVWFSDSGLHPSDFGPFSSSSTGAAFFRESIRSDSNIMELLVKTDPELAEAFEEDDHDILREILQDCHRQTFQPQQYGVLQNRDPVHDDVIRPFEDESATHQVKRYVVMEVNGHPLEYCTVNNNVKRLCRTILLGLVDGNYKGVIHGIQSDILGRVHSTLLKFGDKVYEGSLLVWDSDSPNVDFIFGLDMLRKHKCIIDFKAEVLQVGVREVSVPLFKDKDTAVKEHATKVGSSSGAKEAEKGEKWMVTFEDKVRELRVLGFEEETIVNVLKECNEDPFQALGALWRRFNNNSICMQV